MSNNSISLFNFNHCCFFVTPGLLAVLATFFLISLLINVDFPTFGTPITIDLIALGLIPLATWRAIFSESSSLALSITLFKLLLFFASV